MEQILIACGDVDLLRKIAGDLPEGRFKPIATKTGSGIVDKIRGRDVAIAIVHSSLADVAAGAFCQQLQALAPAPHVLLLVPG